jgi:hypothetical protein
MTISSSNSSEPRWKYREKTETLDEVRAREARTLSPARMRAVYWAVYDAIQKELADTEPCVTQVDLVVHLAGRMDNIKIDVRIAGE